MSKERKRKYRRILWALLVAGIISIGWFAKPATLKFSGDILKDLPTMFGYLVLISLFVERAIEVFLSAWRSGGADKLDREIAGKKKQISEIVEAAGGLPRDPSPEFTKLEELNGELDSLDAERTRYRADSRFVSQWLGLGIGVLVALVGVRVLGNIVDVASVTDGQVGLFYIVDILLTGAVLAGGSEAINKIMKLYNGFMTSLADKQDPKK